jgi:transmembrane sensor
MSRFGATPAQVARLQAASEWVQRLDGSSDPALAEEWMEWCGNDSLNFLAFEEMQRLWEAFPRTTQATATAMAAPVAATRRITRRGVRRAVLWGLAASMLVAVGAVGWLARDHAHEQAWSTASGGQRRETLPDGSQLDLAPESHLSIRFSLLRREARLNSGQVYFAVAHNALRPFVVHTDDLTATAAGTAFDVRTGPDGSVVTVSEGSVSVIPRTADGDAGFFRVSAGQRVKFSPADRRLSVSDVDPKIAESWRSGVLQFVGEPLQDVVGEIDRFVKRRIVLAAALRETRFTGTVSPANLDEWLEALQQIYPIEVIKEAADEIDIRPRGSDVARHAK